jgi:xylulose-5-phosphate/fructose-6-phosphate phosphoketolase
MSNRLQILESKWRKPLGSLNYIETSTWTRQEHNGYSHQNPSFIQTVLNLKPKIARVYFPPDANTFLSTLAHCLRSHNYVNLIVGSKQPQAVYLSIEEAETHCKAGASIFKFASTEEGLHPDVVLVGIGPELTAEVISAAAWMRAKVPELRVRVVNVTDLMILEAEGNHPHSLTDQGFDFLFTEDKPIHINYHGYPSDVKSLLFGRPNIHRASVEGYREEGTTTTPFDMMLRNHVSRFHVVLAALAAAAKTNPKIAARLTELTSLTTDKLQKARDYILKTSTGKHAVYWKQSVF